MFYVLMDWHQLCILKWMIMFVLHLIISSHLRVQLLVGVLPFFCNDYMKNIFEIISSQFLEFKSIQKCKGLSLKRFLYKYWYHWVSWDMYFLFLPFILIFHNNIQPNVVIPRMLINSYLTYYHSINLLKQFMFSLENMILYCFWVKI